MDNKKTLIGKVINCKSKEKIPDVTVRDITKIEVIPNANWTEELGGGFVINGLIERATELSNSKLGLKLKLDGIHRINKKEEIKVTYETHTGVHWIKGYSILDKKGDIVYSYN